MKEERKAFNPEYELDKRALPSDSDIVFKHPDNPSNIRIKDNGVIQFFVNGETGLRLDPKYNSITLFGDSTKVYSPSVHFMTEDDGLKWNFTPFNRALSDPLTEIVTTKRYGTNALINSLTNTGAYIGASGPVSPGTISSVQSFNFKGITAYKGEERLNMLSTIKAAMNEISQDLGMSNIKELI